MNGPTENLSSSSSTSSLSWDVIDESDSSRKSSIEKIDIQNLEDDSINRTSEHFQDVLEESILPKETISKNKASLETDDYVQDDGFLSYDEFAQERMMDQNYSSGNEDNSKKKRKKDKIKKEPLSILSLAASLLTITGLTLLFLACPDNIERKTLDKVQNNYFDVISNISNGTAIIDNMNKTAEIIHIVHENHMFEKLNKTLSTDMDKNLKETQYKPLTKEEFLIKLDKGRKQRAEELMKDNKSKMNNSSKIIPELAAHIKLADKNLVPRKSSTKKFTDLLTSPKFHAFLCAILQDVCLIKLVTELSKIPDNSTHKCTHHTTKSNKRCAKCCGSKTPKKLKVSKSEDDNKNKVKESKIAIRENEKVPKLSNVKYNKRQNIVCGCQNQCPSIFNSFPNLCDEQDSMTVSQYEKLVYPRRKNENGKSECERRFEELDNKFQNVGLTHRQKIQRIRQKFKEEVSDIKINEKEASFRNQRIRQTREKYVQKLKSDREKYLIELRKLREEKQKVMRDICIHKKILTSDQKDASVGNYAVLLPGSYDFQQKLKFIQEKENLSKTDMHFTRFMGPDVSNKTEQFNLTKFASNPAVPKGFIYGNDGTIRLPKKCVSKKQVITESEPNTNHSELQNEEKSTSPGKPKSKKGRKTVWKHLEPEVVAKNVEPRNSNDNVEEFKVDDEEFERITVVVEEHIKNQEDVISDDDDFFKVVTKKKCKLSKSDIYGAAFDKQGGQIKKKDLDKWNNKANRNSVHALTISKQDPLKSYKEKIVHKGIL